MNINLSKSRFVSACERCNKYAWLDKYKPEQKAPVSEFTESLFDNGHKVGELAKKYFNVDADMSAYTEDGYPDLEKMIENTDTHLELGTKVIAEASLNFGGLFCSVDILVRNDDGTYDLYEVKSSKQEEPTANNPLGVKKEYILDLAYQRYVFENSGVPVNKTYLVMLARDYVRGATLDLNEYFFKCDVTDETEAKQVEVAAKIAALQSIVASSTEPVSVICNNCNKCDYFGYCGKDIPTPSPFDVYNLRFSKKCNCYHSGISFFDMLYADVELKDAAKLQIEYYNRPNDLYIDKAAVQDFLNSLSYPLYSLDFETYQAVIPEYEGIATYEQVPFQYSLHIVDNPSEDIADMKECHFLDLSGADTRRAIAESLVKNIPFGACVMAYHESTERNIVARLAKYCPDLADHLLSFTYRDPLKLFEDGHYYVKAMGKSFSLKSVAPAMYPNDKGMDYHNLEGDIKNGTQAMSVYLKTKECNAEEIEKIEKDLVEYCALDTLAVVKILKKLYEDAL